MERIKKESGQKKPKLPKKQRNTGTPNETEILNESVSSKNLSKLEAQHQKEKVDTGG